MNNSVPVAFPWGRRCIPALAELGPGSGLFYCHRLELSLGWVHWMGSEGLHGHNLPLSVVVQSSAFNAMAMARHSFPTQLPDPASFPTNIHSLMPCLLTCDAYF